MTLSPLHRLVLIAGVAGAVLGCEAAPTSASAQPRPQTTTAHAAPATPRPVQSVAAEADSPYSRPGFIAQEEGGRLWVQRPGQEKNDKHVTLIGLGPAGMTVKAPDRETAYAYLVARPGFQTMIEDGRVWAQRPGQEKNDKHVTLIGVGPMGMTVKAPDRETAYAYLVARPGFQTMIEDGRIWAQRPGQEKSDKHVTFIGNGPMGLTLKAPDRETALAYMAARPGFDVRIEDERLWVLKPGQQMSEKHITLVGVGPMGMTVKAVDRETAQAYLASAGY